MENYYLPEINPIGQQHVERWLGENGYFDIRKELLQANDYVFFASGTTESILVQTRTFLHPQRTFKLSDFEIDALVAKASKNNLVAYAAYITINEVNELVGEIMWERLS